MYSKYHEIEAIVEDIIENVIIEAFEGSFSSKKECNVALDLLKTKLEELEDDIFDDFYDN
jgi:hypothetical protein